MMVIVIWIKIQSELHSDMKSDYGIDNHVTKLMINYIDYRYAKTKGQTKAGTVFNSSINKLASDMNYSSNFVEGEEFATSGTDYNLAWTPVIDGTVKAFNTDGTEIAVTALNTATGKATLGATPTGDTVKFNYYYNNEDVRSDGFAVADDGVPTAAGNYQTNDNFGLAAFTNIPEIEMKLNSLPVIAQARALRSFWAFDAQYELQKELI